MSDIGKLEYRVREMKRFYVSRYEESADGKAGATSHKGNYDNATVAYEVAYALCKSEHDQLGFPPDDPRIQYPKAEEIWPPRTRTSALTDEQVKHMADRFLSWRLPENFSPDGGVSFDPIMNKGNQYESRREPTGTNLFDATQAVAMVRHMLVDLPSA